MKVKEILKLIKYKDTIIRINLSHTNDYFEYTRSNCDLLCNSILDLEIDEIIPLERRLEIYVKEV